MIGGFGSAVVEAFSGVDANSLLKGRKEHMQCEDKGKEKEFKMKKIKRITASCWRYGKQWILIVHS